MNENKELAVFIFNQPAHSFWEGDIEYWKSCDNGDTWQFKSRVTDHDPGTNRMNIAAGRNGDGEFIVIVSGWDKRLPAGTFKECDWRMNKNANRLQSRTYLSPDNGKSWLLSENFPQLPVRKVRNRSLTPFGKIVLSEDKCLNVSAYAPTSKGHASYFVRSRDNGRSWEKPRLLNPEGNETSLLYVGEGKWLAASRENDMHVELFSSNDDGVSWRRKMPLTLPHQAPGDFFRTLNGERLFYIYGNRCKGNYGLDIRFSDDRGESWGAPTRIVNVPDKDSGYPSSVLVSEDDVVTAYYTKLDGDFEYEMRIVKWKLSQL
jgi:hypothetical protein